MILLLVLLFSVALSVIERKELVEVRLSVRFILKISKKMV